MKLLTDAKKMFLIKKWIIYSSLAIALVSFIYSLGFFSSMWQLNMDIAYNELYFQMQDFNILIFYFSLIPLILFLVLFFLRTQIRKKLYLTNIITIFVTAISMLVFSIVMLINIPGIKSEYSEVDPAGVNRLSDTTFKIDTIAFDLGLVIAILVIIAFISLVFIAVSHLIINKNNGKAMGISDGK